jgi:hypothetical protein
VKRWIDIKKEKFFEMAKVGSIKDLEIQVYTDHKPIHFHVIKKDYFDVRVSIDTLKVISYKWQKSGKEISPSELKAISKWIELPNSKNKKITNKEAIELFWDSMN